MTINIFVLKGDPNGKIEVVRFFLSGIFSVLGHFRIGCFCHDISAVAILVLDIPLWIFRPRNKTSTLDVQTGI